MICVYALDISGINEELYSMGYALAGRQRQSRADKLLSLNQKITCIFTELLLKHALKIKGIPHRNLKYEYNKAGKPCLVDSDIFFNHSHSKNMICTAVSDEETGCDIEKIRGLKKNIFKRIFPKLSVDTMTDLELIKLWTGLESCIKLKGESVFSALNKDICLEEYNYYEICRIPGYHITLCSYKKIDDVVLKQPDAGEILSEIS